MTAKRFMIDDAGTLIDMHTRDTFDYVSDVCDLLNELNDKYIDEFSLRETLQLELQRVEEENKTLKTRFKEERELAMKLGRECDTLIIKNQKLELEVNRLEMIIKTGKRSCIND